MVKIKTRSELIDAYISFFKSKGHAEIPSSSLIPENDPTVLFTTAGMHPLVPYLLGQKHPLGKRLVDVQKCIRTGDIDSVGDEVHHTFFEMLGNWSLGDYFKKEAIEFSFEFLTSMKWLGLSVDKLAVSVFGGDKDAPRDDESAKVWESLGIVKERIAFLGKGDNWWGPAGSTGPCGPDTEMFYWTGSEKAPRKFDPLDKKWVEIWNDVLMQYSRDKRLILVDGMHCLYDKDFKINKELLGLIDGLNAHNILVVNNFREKGYLLLKENTIHDTNWQAFSLEEKGIKKDNPEYFKSLLKRFNLVPEEIIYFDHDKKNVETAKKLGILSKQYTDVKSIKEFVEESLWTFIPLRQKNVDTGMGVERTLAVLNGLSDNYLAAGLKEIIEKIEEISGKDYLGREREMRIIADHARASVFILGEGKIKPGNVGQGYVLRRLIRRAVRYGRMVGIKQGFLPEIADVIIRIYGKDYDELVRNGDFVLLNLGEEEERFGLTLEKGLKKFGSMSSGKKLSGKDAFLLFQSYGFPIEITLELAREAKIEVDVKGFEKEFEKHQELSRTASAGVFKSGLADNSEIVRRLHTATHLLNAALKKVLKSEVKQKGSNITPERLRFDFSFSRKLSDGEKEEVEDLVNKWISQGIDVKREEMPLAKAMKSGAEAEFGARYPAIVSVYSVGGVSKEICTGPHVSNTSEIGKFRILKEESVAAGVRRIKAIVE